MSRGAWQDRRTDRLFAATKDRALSIGDLARHAFDLDAQHGKQRLSATRAAHRLLQRAGAVGAEMKSPSVVVIMIAELVGTSSRSVAVVGPMNVSP